MYRKVEEICHLDHKDKLIISLEDTELKILINNTRIVKPNSMKLEYRCKYDDIVLSFSFLEGEEK